MEIEDLRRRMSNEIIYDILAEVDAKRDQITRLLENGQPLFDTLHGQPLLNLYQKRRDLWLKVKTIDMLASILVKHLQ